MLNTVHHSGIMISTIDSSDSFSIVWQRTPILIRMSIIFVPGILWSGQTNVCVCVCVCVCVNMFEKNGRRIKLF